jgi:voltage-gated potassium channel
MSQRASFAWRLILLAALIAIAILGHVIDRDGLRDNADGQVSILDIIYFTVITVTTVGYGDITPVSDGARMFDTFVVTPIRIFVWLIFLGTAYDFMLRHSWERWRMGRIQRALNGHTIVCGYGTTGTEVVAELLRDGTAASDIVVVDMANARLEGAEAVGLGTVLGDATQNAVLEAAGVARASAVIICPSRDDSAVLISLTAKRLAPNATRVVAIRSTENEILAIDAGADVIVNPVSFAGRMLAGALRGAHVTEYLDDLITAQGRIKLRERGVEPNEIGLSLAAVRPGIGLRLYRNDRAYARWESEAEALMENDTIVEIVPISEK